MTDNDWMDAVPEGDEPALCPCGNGYTGHVITDYQGWSNKATWCAALWLGNDEPLYRAAQAALANPGVSPNDAAVLLSRVWKYNAPDMARRELATAGGEYHVDWSEIADGWGE